MPAICHTVSEEAIGRRSCPLRVIAAVAIVTLGCGRALGGESDAAGDDGVVAAADAATDAPAEAGSATAAAAIAAAKAAAESDAACAGVAPFYWEIGDAAGKLGGGSTGAGLVSAATALNIASASKFIWGAYVVQRFKDDFASIDLNAMTMRSGRTNFTSCAGTDTVGACCARLGDAGIGTKNCDVTAADVGFFDYGGAHFQQYAVDLGLGDDGDDALATEMKRLLGDDVDVSFTQPQPAGGGKASAAAYAVFLRKILTGALAIADHLGGDAVCTLPRTCAQSHGSPVPRDWHYSYGHWVEDDPQTGDGAFSSPGAFGFYPWIDAGKHHYGIVARESLRGLGGALADTPYYQSVVCGEAIRRAFLSTIGS